MLHLATTENHLRRIGVDLIEPKNADANTPRFGLPFDARSGISTGISTMDRARTVQAALDSRCRSRRLCHTGSYSALGGST